MTPVTTPYLIKFAPTAAQQMKTLPPKQCKLIIKLVEALAINPRPPDVKKIEGMTGLYSETIHHSRVIYKIEEQEVFILVIK